MTTSDIDIIAIVMARGGSKRLPGKNMADLCGKPLICYSIEAALKSRIFKRVVVTTDSEQIGKVALTYEGVELIHRDPSLAKDTTPTFPVIEDVLQRVPSEYFCHLQPTSPLRTEQHIREGYESWLKRLDRFDFCVSVKRSHTPHVLIHELDTEGGMSQWIEDFSQYRSQDYLDYQPNGAINFARSVAYLERKQFYGDRSLAYIMDERSSVDIDSEVDIKLASLLLNAKQQTILHDSEVF